MGSVQGSILQAVRVLCCVVTLVMLDFSIILPCTHENLREMLYLITLREKDHDMKT